MAILSPSTCGLHKLLNICASYAIKHDIIYNVKKTQCMVVPSTKFKLENTPSVFLNSAKLQYVDSYNDLGMFIHVRNADIDIVTQLKCVTLRTNILMRTFSSCFVEVKLFLFKSYCSNCYCSHLWYNVTMVQMNKLRITYNNAMTRLFNLQPGHPSHNSKQGQLSHRSNQGQLSYSSNQGQLIHRSNQGHLNHAPQ